MLTDFYFSFHFTILSFGFRYFQSKMWSDGENYLLDIHFLFFTFHFQITYGNPYDVENTEAILIEDEKHICKYCGVLTAQPHNECYKAPEQKKLH